MSQPGEDPPAVAGRAPAEPAGADLSDAALVRRVAERREDALAALYDRYGAMLLALARRVLGSDGDAEEVLQDAFVQLWRQAARYDPRRSSVSTWLVLITRSRAIDLLRSRQVRERAAVAAGEEDPRRHASPEGPASVWYGERRQRVLDALRELPAEQRAVLEMAFFEGLTQTEIAARSDTPLGTVKTRTLLAMKKLRAAMRDQIRDLL
ncbi:MAG TPA: sigma-70 family RNA polymerase sigma factor [Thermoanaerobaculia bacterium]|nr:sigma-70 family RNA polymerase sigma factor [Thermoanaerobaculia bacterium]